MVAGHLRAPDSAPVVDPSQPNTLLQCVCVCMSFNVPTFSPNSVKFCHPIFVLANYQSRDSTTLLPSNAPDAPRCPVHQVEGKGRIAKGPRKGWMLLRGNAISRPSPPYQNWWKICLSSSADCDKGVSTSQSHFGCIPQPMPAATNRAKTKTAKSRRRSYLVGSGRGMP